MRVRKRPGMYIGSTDGAVSSSAWKIAHNAVDEALAWVW